MSDDVLADAVRAELTAVGLTVLGLEDGYGGVRITVDEGVWVSWRPGPQLAAASGAALRRGAYRGDERHPAMTYWLVAVKAVNGAIAAVLSAAGFDIREDADEYRPGELLVESRPPVPHWRDPVAAPLDGAAGFMPGVRVRVRAGELAGAELVVAMTKVDFRTGELVGYRLRRPGGDGVIDVPADNVEFAGDEHFG